ncbi:MAG: hypothetical protein HY897_16770 [Deltaproteobacteria bacterium]|nr:hypothetical protein [Deltaproteobacteria bacterium]
MFAGLADRYRNPVMVLADGMMGQLMEPVEFRKPGARVYPDEFVLDGAGAGRGRAIKSLYLHATINRLGPETIVILGVDKIDETARILEQNWISLLGDEVYSL